VRDAVTTDPRQVRQVLLGVTGTTDQGFQLLRDEACLDLLNQYRPGQADPAGFLDGAGSAAAQGWLDHARADLQAQLGDL